MPATPVEWLSDNGSPYVARERRHFAKDLNLVPLTTAIASPQSNGMAESFVKTFRRDYVAQMACADAIAVMRQLPAAFEHYNNVHPHSALKMLSPRMFRAKHAQLSNTPCPEMWGQLQRWMPRLLRRLNKPESESALIED